MLKTFIFSVFLLLCAACSDEEVVTTTRNLDRPGPLTMVCAGRTGDARITTGLTPSSCTTDAGLRKTESGAITGVPQGTLFGFVANTARGEVAVFRPATPGTPLLDFDPGNPGFGFIPVGSMPTDIDSSSDGCRVVTANSGSCDLSTIDVPAAMELSARTLSRPAGAVVSRIVPHTAAGPLYARPQEVVIDPKSLQDKGEAACPVPGSYRAYVTFPSCNLVAHIDLNTGRVLSGLVVTASGFTITDQPTCRPECAKRETITPADRGAALDRGPVDRSTAVEASATDQGTPDAGVPDAAPLDAGAVDAASGSETSSGADASGAGGGAEAGVTPDAALDAGPGDARVSANGVQPFGLAINLKGDRLYVSSAGAGFVSAVSLDLSNGAFVSGSKILLEGNPGTTRVALSPVTNKLGQFVYAIARDRTVRVISTALNKECETNYDPVAISGSVALSTAACFPVGGANTPVRLPTEKTTGLRFGSKMPQDIVFVKNPQIPDKQDAGTDLGPMATPMEGLYAMVVATDGTVFVVDLEDLSVVKTDTTALTPSQLPHRFRNRLMGTTSGIPDASVSSVKLAGSGGVPVVVNRWENSAGDNPGGGVYLRSMGEEMYGTAWQMIYEESFMERVSGNLRVTGPLLTLDDPGADFCSAGVQERTFDVSKTRFAQHGDIAKIVGCKDDGYCGLGETCVKALGTPTEYGICVDADLEDELFTTCRTFVGGDREYLVVGAEKTRLTLDVLPARQQNILFGKRPTGGCKTNADCEPYFLCAVSAGAGFGVNNSQSIKAGDCFRPGCKMGDACPGSNRCVEPLDGSPAVCSNTPLPLEISTKSCTTSKDCRSNSSHLNKTCVSDTDCVDPLLECRKASSDATQRTCVDRGMNCASFPGRSGATCVRTSPCLNQLLRYQVIAGRSFSLGNYSRRITDTTTGRCVDNPKDSPLLVHRVPVGLPIYPATLGPQCTASPDPLKTPQPNPCVQRLSEGYSGVTDTSTASPTEAKVSGASTVVRFASPEFWFSLGVSHLVPQTAGSVSSAAPDAGVSGTDDDSDPMPRRGLSLQLLGDNGFRRLVVPFGTEVALPARLAVGPDGWVYLVDMGDIAGYTGSNGKVRRFDRYTLSSDTFVVR